MRWAVIILVLLCLTGCVSDDPDGVVYDRPAYDEGGYNYDTYVYDYRAPGPGPYLGGGYYYGRPYPYYIGGGRYYHDRHDHDYRDHDRHNGPDRERVRDNRPDGPPPRADAEPPRVRTRTGFQTPSDRPAPRSSSSGGRQGRR